jgi:hypothetical protein
VTEPGSGDRISELFSQALGEQVAEERKIQQILSDVRASVARVEEATGDALRDTVRTSVQATAGAAVDGAMARTVGPGLAELRTALDALDRRVDDMVRRLDEHSESLAAMPHGVEIDAVGLSLASLRSSALTREDLQQVVTASTPGPVPAPELDLAVLVPLVEAAVAKHTEAVTRELRGAFTEGSEAIGTHLDARFSAQAGALDDQLRLQAAAVKESVTAVAAGTPAPLTASAVQEIVTSVLAARRAEIPVAQRPPSAAEVAAEISGGLAGLRADLSEELAELVEDRLNELPTSSTITALADQLSAVKADLTAWRSAGPPTSSSPVALDLHAIAAAVVEALPAAVPPPLLPPAPPSADVELTIAEVVNRVMPPVVTDAVRASELRLRAHIDEAVLALAEAVLGQAQDGSEATVAPPHETPALAPLASVSAPARTVPTIEPSAHLDPHVGEPADDADGGDIADDVGEDMHGKRRWFRRGEDE